MNDKDEKQLVEEVAATGWNETGTGEYTLVKPIKFDGKVVTKLMFDFDSLTGKDLILCAKQARRRDPQEITPARVFSLAYQVTVAAKAAGVVPELIDELGAKDFTQITQAAENFLITRG